MPRQSTAKPAGTKPMRSTPDGAADEPSPQTSKGQEARHRIIAVAETLFTRQGFDGTSMRDIAAAANMKAASMYYHFPSKEELLWSVWEKGGLEQVSRAREAIAGLTDPWERMEAACVAHVTGLLDWRRANQVLFVMPPWQYPEGIRDRVIALRDEYEKTFVDLIAQLPLREGVDRHHFRLTLIGALSWPLYWYKADGDPPALIARRMLDLLRYGVQA